MSRRTFATCASGPTRQTLEASCRCETPACAPLILSAFSWFVRTRHRRRRRRRLQLHRLPTHLHRFRPHRIPRRHHQCPRLPARRFIPSMGIVTPLEPTHTLEPPSAVPTRVQMAACHSLATANRTTQSLRNFRPMASQTDTCGLASKNTQATEVVIKKVGSMQMAWHWKATCINHGTPLRLHWDSWGMNAQH